MSGHFTTLDEDLTAKSCYFTTGQRYTAERIFTFAGYYRKELTEIAVRLTETRILGMYEQYTTIISEYKYDRKLAWMDYWKSLSIPFKISDSAILSIFMLWEFVIGFAGVICLVERCWSQQELITGRSIIVKFKEGCGFIYSKSRNWIISILDDIIPCKDKDRVVNY